MKQGQSEPKDFLKLFLQLVYGRPSVVRSV